MLETRYWIKTSGPFQTILRLTKAQCPLWRHQQAILSVLSDFQVCILQHICDPISIRLYTQNIILWSDYDTYKVPHFIFSTEATPHCKSDNGFDLSLVTCLTWFVTKPAREKDRSSWGEKSPSEGSCRGNCPRESQPTDPENFHLCKSKKVIFDTLFFSISK